MNQHSTEFYHAAIKTCHPTAYDIRQPAVRGAIGTVFIADIAPGETFVYKFGNKDIVARNCMLSKTLALAGIPAPYCAQKEYLGAAFEFYPYCHDKTLCEYMVNGTSDSAIFDVYCGAIRAQAQISKIASDEISFHTYKHYHQLLSHNMGRALPRPVACAYRAFMGAIARQGPQLLLHNDMHIKNILVDDNCNFSRLLDLDAISFCNENYSVMQMLRAYPLKNIDQLLDFYEDITHRKLHRDLIKGGVKAFSIARTPDAQVARMLSQIKGRTR